MRVSILAAPLLSALLMACSSDPRDPANDDVGPVLIDTGSDGSGNAADSGTLDTTPRPDIRQDVVDPEDTVDDAGEPGDIEADTSSCSDERPCAEGTICVDGSCVAAACEPDESRCSDDGDLLRCVSGSLRTIPCAEESSCEMSDDGARCELPECTPNAVGCADAFSAFVCDGQGTDRFILPCNSDQFCVDGVCRTQECSPGQGTCDGDTAQRCDDTGAEVVSENCLADCPDGLICACQDGRCTQNVCVADVARCEGNTRVVCDASGASETRSSCGDRVCIAGECVESTCTALETECIGDVLSTCNDTGTERTTRNCLESGAYCSDGACVPQACVPNSSVCLDIDTRNICNTRGTGRSPADCSAGTFCSTGTCTPAVCEPGTTRCSGVRLQTCDAAGSGYASTNCSGGQECRTSSGTARCTSLVCSPGETQCAVGTNARLVCNADQTGFDSIACSSTQTCSGGSCLNRICTPGATRCSGTSVESCVDDGLRWQLTTCGGGQVCSVTGGTATCGSQVCTPGSGAVCRAGDLQTCNATGTGFNLTTDCPFGCADASCVTDRLGGMCDTNVDCRSGFYCAGGRCIPTNSIYVPSGMMDIGTDRTAAWVTALERPRHTLSRNQTLIVEKYEVTQQEWQDVMSSNPSYFTGCGSDCPVESVSLYDVIYYLNQRSIFEGLTPCYTLSSCLGTPGAGCAVEGETTPTFCDGDYSCATVTTVLRCDGYRLPTNSEWEVAAGTDGSDYPGGINNTPGTSVCADTAALSNYAQYCANSTVTYSPCTNLSGSSGPACAGPAPVGSYLPLPNGLYDALGNVYEWVWDNDDPYPFGLTAEPVVRTLRNTDFGIRRGGGWWSFVTNARLTQRERTVLTTRSNLNGFRIARTLFPPGCYNGVRDSGETEVDCGSPNCSECP